MNYIVSRLKEASTYAGIAAVLSAFPVLPHSSEISEMIPHAGVIIAGLLAIALPGGNGSQR